MGRFLTQQSANIAALAEKKKIIRFKITFFQNTELTEINS
jgi:hypothetical protein